MRLGVDLAAQNLFCAGDRDSRDLATQLFACAVGFLLDLGSRRSQLALTLLNAIRLPFGHNFVGPGMRLVKDAARLLTGFLNDFFSLRFGLFEAVLAALGGSKAVRYLRLALLDGLHNRWPNELHAEPDKHNHCDRLADESHINVHRTLLNRSVF